MIFYKQPNLGEGMQDRIFGREAEIKVLDQLWFSHEAEFLAIYLWKASSWKDPFN